MLRATGPRPLAGFVLGSSKFKSSFTLVNNQLVCLQPGGILNPVKFDLNHLFKSFTRPHYWKGPIPEIMGLPILRTDLYNYKLLSFVKKFKGNNLGGALENRSKKIIILLKSKFKIEYFCTKT